MQKRETQNQSQSPYGQQQDEGKRSIKTEVRLTAARGKQEDNSRPGEPRSPIEGASQAETTGYTARKNDGFKSVDQNRADNGHTKSCKPAHRDLRLQGGTLFDRRYRQIELLRAAHNGKR